MIKDHIITLRATHSDAITTLRAQGYRGAALRGALAALICINTPTLSRAQSHALVRFMGV